MFQKLHARMVRQVHSLLRVPLKLIPFALQRQILQQVLNRRFRQVLADGELNFLKGLWLKIEVSDLQLSWLLTLDEGKLAVAEQGNADVSFSAGLNDFILIAARKEDPDTLFFQRRLSIERDIELGLLVKNLIDSVELDMMPVLLRTGLLRLADFVYSGMQENRGDAFR